MHLENKLGEFSIFRIKFATFLSCQDTCLAANFLASILCIQYININIGLMVTHYFSALVTM